MWIMNKNYFIILQKSNWAITNYRLSVPDGLNLAPDGLADGYNLRKPLWCKCPDGLTGKKRYIPPSPLFALRSLTSDFCPGPDVVVFCAIFARKRSHAYWLICLELGSGASISHPRSCASLFSLFP